MPLWTDSLSPQCGDGSFRATLAFRREKDNAGFKLRIIYTTATDSIGVVVLRVSHWRNTQSNGKP